jgi:predicted glycoside hydrolase/deacetylase ChbG (UPF0249 family)
MGNIKRSFNFSLCADDFALSPGVSRGILEALQAGRLSATGVMTTRPSWSQAARALAHVAADADIGLHLNLTLAAPLSRMPKFAPSGELPGIRQVLEAARKRQLPEAEIRQEIACQLDSFLDHFGQAPDFVDGHQHIQVLPGLRHWLFDELESRGLAGKSWLRDSGDRFSDILRRGIEVKKASVVAWISRDFARSAKARGFTTNIGFAGFSAFAAERNFGADFARHLVAPGSRHLVMCHPGYVDDVLVSLDPVTTTREQELAFLLSPRFKDLLDTMGARLTRLSQRGPEVRDPVHKTPV